MSEAGQLFKLESSELTMSSREIAELCGKRHDNVMRDIRDMLAELANSGDLGVLKIEETPYVSEQNGQIYTEFNLDKELTTTLVAGYSVIIRRRIVSRWIELEGQAATSAVAIPDFSDPVAAARAWADAKEREQQASAALAIAAPKAEFVDRYVEAETGSMGFRQVAKLLGVKENVFRTFLIEHRVMYRLAGVMTPYAEHLDAGRFEVKTGIAHEHAYQTSKFTAKGVAWVSEKYRKAVA